MNELMIFEKNAQAVVSSRVIAEKFHKRHDNVIRGVESYKKDVLNFEEMFIESKELDDYGRAQKSYLLNRDGFSLLVMGFTGSDALQWKLKYIEAFNRMEAIIRERQSSEWLITRKQGKLIRRSETDAIALLIPYAEEQGSHNMRKNAYTLYTKLVNSLVGIEAGERDKASFKVLSTIAFLEDMMQHTIMECIAQGVYYKEIYKRCKANGEQIIRFAYLPERKRIA